MVFDIISINLNQNPNTIMFKNTITGEISNVQEPTSFLDIFAIAHFNCNVNHIIDADISMKYYADDDVFDYLRSLGGMVDIEPMSPEGGYSDKDKKCLYNHLTNPDTCFEFLKTRTDKRFFTACVLSLISDGKKDAISFYANNKLASIIASCINVPMVGGNNNSFCISGVNFHDLNLFDPELGETYKRYFGDSDSTPIFLREYDPTSTAIKFKKVDHNAVIPTKKRRSDTGLDVTVIKKVKTDQWGNEWYDTGLQIEVPEGYYTELIGRSSLIKKGWQLANCTGIIDETYRNNLMCVFTRLHPDAPSLEGELPNRVCQLVFRKHEIAHGVEVDQLSITDRNKGGFGSTGL
jgi:dUTP pyrophosphatase